LTQDNSAIVRRFVDDVINQGKMGSAEEFVWEDVVEQVPLPGQGSGLEGMKDVLRGMRSAFPDIDFSIKEQVCEGDKVVSRFEWTGTHKAEFMGVPATNCPRISAKASAPTGSRSALKSSRSTAIGLRSTMSMTLVILVYPGAAGHRTAHSTYREGVARGPYPNSVLYPPPGPRVPRLPAG
jgi:predicted ester cyclase